MKTISGTGLAVATIAGAIAIGTVSQGASANTQATTFLGIAGDVPVPGDYDGDGTDEVAVFRNGAWFVEGQATTFLGIAGDVPVPGDYDGDGTDEVAVFRNGAWFVEGQATTFLGIAGDVPVPGDYDGDGTTERAVFRPSVGGWYVEGTTPPSTVPPAAGGFPSAATTGVPAGTSLTSSGSLSINQSGTVIDGLDVSGTIRVNANNVTIRNSRVRASDFALINIKDGVTGTVIEDVELDGKGRSNGTQNSMGVIGSATVRRADIHGVENGFTPFSNSVIRDSYIHDLGAPGDPHVDGIQIDGGISNVVIEGNTILSWDTSAVMIDNYFGPINGVEVRGNYLGNQPGKTTAFTVYSDGQFGGGSIRNVVFADNTMESGYWGYSSIVNNNATWTNNINANTGQPVGPND